MSSCSSPTFPSELDIESVIAKLRETLRTDGIDAIDKAAKILARDITNYRKVRCPVLHCHVEIRMSDLEGHMDTAHQDMADAEWHLYKVKRVVAPLAKTVFRWKAKTKLYAMKSWRQGDARFFATLVVADLPDRLWCAWITAAGTAEMAARFRAEIRLDCGEQDSSNVFHGRVWHLDCSSRSLKELKVEGFSAAVFPVHAGIMTKYTGGHKRLKKTTPCPFKCTVREIVLGVANPKEVPKEDPKEDKNAGNPCNR